MLGEPAQRAAAGTWNPVSVMPSGSKTRLPSTSASGAPVTRSMSTPATVAPVLYRQRSPGWSSSGRLPSPAIHSSGVSDGGGHGGPSVLRPSSASPHHWQGLRREDAPEPEPERQHVLHRDRHAAWRLVSDSSASCESAARGARSASGSQRSTWSSSRHGAVLDQQHRGRPGDRFTGGDAMRKIASRPIGARSPVTRQVPGRRHVDLAAARDECHQPGHRTARHVPGQIAVPCWARRRSVNPPAMRFPPSLAPPGVGKTFQRDHYHRRAAPDACRRTRLSAIDDYLARNAEYALNHVGGLPVEPGQHVAVVACMDSRMRIFPMLSA